MRATPLPLAGFSACSRSQSPSLSVLKQRPLNPQQLWLVRYPVHTGVTTGALMLPL